MKTRSLGARTSCISKSRWLTYATASAATMLAGGQSAEAAIHYSGIVDSKVMGTGSHRKAFQLDQAHDSIVFEHEQYAYGFPSKLAGFKVKGVVAGSFRGPQSIDYHYVTKLQQGDLVSNGNFTQAPNLSGFGLMATVYGGSFVLRGEGFVGFSFDNGSGKQYGWARVFMSGYKRGNGIILLDYAYADPGESIAAGQTSETGGTAPAMGSLGLLAVGAAGLLAWRGRRRGGRLGLE